MSRRRRRRQGRLRRPFGQTLDCAVSAAFWRLRFRAEESPGRPTTSRSLLPDPDQSANRRRDQSPRAALQRTRAALTCGYNLTGKGQRQKRRQKQGARAGAPSASYATPTTAHPFVLADAGCGAGLASRPWQWWRLSRAPPSLHAHDDLTGTVAPHSRHKAHQDQRRTWGTRTCALFRVGASPRQ